MRIIAQIRPLPVRAGQGPAVYPVVFALDKPYRLTVVKVTPITTAAESTALPIWYLRTSSNSAPVKAFAYGKPIPGMEPLVPGLKLPSLEAGRTYRLSVEAKEGRGSVDFRAGGPVALASSAH